MTVERLADMFAGGWDVDPTTARGMVDRMLRPEFPRWRHGVRRVGGCANPVRLRGTVERNGRTVLDTAGLPDGVLLKRCGNRREAVCAPCSHLHRGDSWQVLAAGIAGGRKGVPDLATHPSTFFTLTAPSFGAVHTSKDDGPCTWGRGTCRHGRPKGCREHHGEGDPLIGQPLCHDCYDYRGHVVFNWTVGKLYNRFTVLVGRMLAKRLGIRQCDFKARYTVRYGRVAEFQQRGSIHLHGVARVDGPGDTITAPGTGVTVEDLEAAIRDAAAAAAVHPDEACIKHLTVRFGARTDVQPLGTAEMTTERAANYLSKYLCKGTEMFRLPPRRLHSAAARDLGLSEHVCRIVEECERLGALGVPRIDRLGHQLAVRAHALSKSLRFSTSFGVLRDERAEWRRRHDHDDDQGDGDGPGITVTNLIVDSAGGWANAGDARFAQLVALELLEERDLAREARYEHGPPGRRFAA